MAIRVKLDELQPVRAKLSDLAPMPAEKPKTPWADTSLLSGTPLDLEKLKVHPSKEAGAFTQFAAGLQRGVVATGEGFTTPKNVGIMGTLGGAALIPGVGEIVVPAAGLYFGYEMLKGAMEQAPAAYAAWQRGDYGTAGELISQAGLGALFAKSGIKHGLQKPLAARTFQPWERGGIRPVPKVTAGMREAPSEPTPAPTRTSIRVPISEITAETTPVRKGLAKTAEESAQILAREFPEPFKPASESAQVFETEAQRLRSEAQSIRAQVERLPLSEEVRAQMAARAEAMERRADELQLPPPPKVTPLTGEISHGTVPSEIGNAPRLDAGKAAGRQGEGEVGPVLEPRPPGNPFWTGSSTTVDVPSGPKYGAVYELRELEDIAPSHIGETFHPNPRYQHRNPRNYEDPANQETVLVGSGPEFNPSVLITDNPTPTNGPPIIDSNGNVFGGNSRTMILERVYSGNPTAVQNYRTMLREKLGQYGIDPAVEAKMKQPVLVRRLVETPADIKRALADFNKKETKDYTPAERAIADSQMMTPKILDYLQGLIEAAGPEATLADVLEGSKGADIINRLVDSGVFTKEEKGGLVDAKTNAITSGGKTRIGQMLIGQLFRDSEQLSRAPQEMKNKLERIVAPLSRLRGAGEWDLKPVVEESLDFLEEMRVRGAKTQEVSKKAGADSVKAAIQGGFITPEEGKGMVISRGKLKGQLTDAAKTLIEDRMRKRQEQELILGQGTMFEGPIYSPDAVIFARFLQRKPTEIASGVKEYTVAADQSLNPTASMFEPISRNEAFAKVFGEEPPSGEKPAGKSGGFLRNEAGTEDVERMRQIYGTAGQALAEGARYGATPQKDKLPVRFPGGFWAKPGGEMIPLEDLARHYEQPISGGVAGALKRGYVRGRGAGVEIHSISAADPDALRNGLREAARHGEEIWVDQIGGSSLYSAEQLREAGWDITRVRPIQQLRAGERGSFSLTPSEPKPPRPPDRQAEWFNFRRMRFSSDAEETNFRRSLDEAVDKYHLDPKEVESHAAVIEAAKSIDPELVKDVQAEADAGITNRAARYAIRQRIGALNREAVSLYDQIDKAKAAAVPEAERMGLERKAQAMEQDLQEYLGMWAGIRSMDGRNLAMHRIMADSTWDLTTWLTKARRAAALPPDAKLPEPIELGIRKAVASGEEAQNVVEAAVPPEIRTELATAKTILQQAETKATKAQATAEEIGKVTEQTEKARDTRVKAQQVLSQSKRELYAARQAYQRVIDKRDRLLSDNPRVKEATKKLNQAKRNLALELHQLQRTGWWDMLSGLWRAGLLTGGKTHARNIIGNFAFQAAEETSRIPASMLDIVLSLGTGRRTTAGTSLRAIAAGSHSAATKGVREAVEIIKHGATIDDLKKIDSVAEMNFQGFGKASNIINRYVNTVFRTMAAEDRIAKTYGVRRSLEAQAKIVALNEARQGALPQHEVLKRAAWLAEHPTEAMATQAIADSEFGTFNNRNIIQQGMSRFASALPAPGRFVMNLAFPFVRTPTNIAARLYSYTPLGATYTIPKAILDAKKASGKFLTPGSQKIVSEAFGRGATGTALIVLGYELAKNAIAVGSGPSTEGERNIREAVGRPRGGVRLGPDWVQFLGFAPIGNLITIGASLYEDWKKRHPTPGERVTGTATLAGRTLLDQPLLTGMQSIIDSLQNPESRGKRVVEGFAGSVIPTAVSDVATLVDPTRREVEGPAGAVANRIPGLRSVLPERTDVLGRPLEANRSAAFNPFLPKTARELTDPLDAEMVRTGLKIGNPSRVADEPEAEFRARRDFVGKIIELEMRKVIGSTDYWAAAEEDRKQMLESAVRRARAEMSEYTTKDEDYQSEAPPARVKRLREYISSLEADLAALRASREIPPAPTVQ